MKTKPDWIELAQGRALPVNEKALEDVILQIQNSTDQEEKASRLWEDLREIQPFRIQASPLVSVIVYVKMTNFLAHCSRLLLWCFMINIVGALVFGIQHGKQLSSEYVG